ESRVNYCLRSAATRGPNAGGHVSVGSLSTVSRYYGQVDLQSVRLADVLDIIASIPMPIKAGTRIGAYEVTSPLGEGGMGVVFRAHDTKLQRDVALKLLPDHFADDPERLARFQREAQVLALLNHPNIAQIYGLEDSPAQRCIVMELVEGETL